MKLALALSERADLQKKIAELSERLNNNAKVQEGEDPAEDPCELMKELDSSLIKLENLIYRINNTNSLTKSGDVTITQLIAKRDCLKERLRVMRKGFRTSERGGCLCEAAQGNR